jgi:hypothetical protein
MIAMFVVVVEYIVEPLVSHLLVSFAGAFVRLSQHASIWYWYALWYRHRTLAWLTDKNLHHLE